MKMERLIGILVTLLSQEKVTAPQLAEKFEVSRRTISRDIEHLCPGRNSGNDCTGEKWRHFHYRWV